MEPQYGYQPTPYNAASNNQAINAQWHKRALLGSIAVAIAALAYFTVTGIQMRQSTGLLTVSTANAKATLSIGQDTSAIKNIGTGSATVRLEPGTYQVTASDGAAGQSMEVTVAKQKTTTAKLDLATATPISTVADYSAQSIYPAPDGNLYFLNLLEDMPYMYNPVTKAARPYMSNVVNNANITWLSPTKLISESSDGTYTYVDNGNTDVITFEDTDSPANIISINQKGELAFVSEDTGVFTTDAPIEVARSIGVAWANSARASIAPDGSVLVYTPDDFTGDKDTAQLYINDTKTDLPQALSGIDHIAWRADSKAFSYTTVSGMYVYDVATRLSIRMTNTTPTNPGSVLWLDAKTLPYAYDGAIWKYSIATKKSDKLGTIEGNLGSIHPFVLADDNKTVYFSTTKGSDGKGGSIYRFMPGYNELSNEEKEALAEQPSDEKPQLTTIEGIEAFQSSGVSTDQVDSLEFAVSTFNSTLSKPATTSLIDSLDFVVNPSDGPNYYTFRLKIGEVPYFTKMEVSGVTKMRLQVFQDAERTVQVYDSGTISSLR